MLLTYSGARFETYATSLGLGRARHGRATCCNSSICRKAMPDKRDGRRAARGFPRDLRPVRAEPRPRSRPSRCSQCGVPFCQIHCPLHNNIPDWLKLTAEGRLEEAYELSPRRPTPCPRSAAASARRTGCAKATASSSSPATARSPSARSRSTSPTPPGRRAGSSRSQPRARARRSRSASSAPGPAGLAAAELLRAQRLSRCTVYDRHDRAGGLLIYGIPGFKLEKEVVERRAERLAEGGIAFHLNFEVGRDATLAELRAAPRRGADRHRRLQGARHRRRPGVGLAGIVPALDYLTASQPQGPRRRGAGVRRRRARTPRASTSWSIGGGDTAMDCVRTAVRQGATSVTCLYRRDRANMPGSQREVAQRRGGGRRVRLAVRARGVRSATGSVDGVRAHAHAPRRARRDRPAGARGRSPGSDFTRRRPIW